jgi:hypothetical protein
METINHITILRRAIGSRDLKVVHCKFKKHSLPRKKKKAYKLAGNFTAIRMAYNGIKGYMLPGKNSIPGEMIIR